jgi:hypothetical protein
MIEREKGPSGQGYMTLPINEIDLDENTERALSQDVPMVEHIEQASTVAFAAVGFAGECMANAMGKLALLIDAAGGIETFSGWDIVQRSNVTGNAFSMIMTRSDRPGAWHLGVQFDPVHSALGAQRMDEMQARREPESMDDRIRRILNPDPDETLFEANPENFRRARAGDHVRIIVGTALKAGFDRGLDNAGPPPRVPDEECLAIQEFLKDPLRFGGRWQGIALTIMPTRKAQSHYDDTKWKTGCGGGKEAHCFLSLELLGVVSEIIMDAGLTGTVQENFNMMLPRKLWTSSSADEVLREEIGIAAVRDNRGLMTLEARNVISDFTARLTARMMQSHLAGIMSVFEHLDRLGFRSKGHAYVCAETMTMSYIMKKDGLNRIFIETKSGRFRVDYEPVSGALKAWYMSAPYRIIGAFTARLGNSSARQGWQVDPLRSDVPGQPDTVEYSQPNLRALNELVASLFSISCRLALKVSEDHA